MNRGDSSSIQKQKAPKQAPLPGLEKRLSASFGGTLLKRAKGRTARPISTRDPMHLVMRSTQARGAWNFRRLGNQTLVDQIVRKTASRYGVRIHEFANAGNHLHLLIRVKNRRVFQTFLRSVTGQIALKISGSSKLKSLKKKFWDYRPFSRIVRGWRGYRVARDYVVLNELETLGIVPGRPKTIQTG